MSRLNSEGALLWAFKSCIKIEPNITYLYNYANYQFTQNYVYVYNDKLISFQLKYMFKYKYDNIT